MKKSIGNLCIEDNDSYPAFIFQDLRTAFEKNLIRSLLMDVINKQPKAGKSFLSQTEDCSLGDSLSSPYEKLLSLCVST